MGEALHMLSLLNYGIYFSDAFTNNAIGFFVQYLFYINKKQKTRTKHHLPLRETENKAISPILFNILLENTVQDRKQERTENIIK